MEYDVKIYNCCLGITLFELYYGLVSYRYKADEHAILNLIYDEGNFVLKKSFKQNGNLKIPTHDNLFK